jgi:hypothetical protein
VANLGRSVASMNKQQTAPATGHHPSTAAEIRQVQRDLATRDRDLLNEGAENYRALQAGTAPSRPLSDHERRVTAHIQKLMNGSTPSHLLVPAVSRDEQIRAERDAIAFVSRDLARREEQARYDEAEKWVSDNAKQWRALCREIILVAERLAALEESARQFLLPIEGTYVKIAMGSTIASGLSLLGVGDPLQEMRSAALKEKIVTDADIRKAQTC